MATNLALSTMFMASILSDMGVGAAADIQAETVHYGPGDKYVGYLVRPKENGPFPGIVVIHEWWGLNDNIKSQAERLAQLGYVALAVDLFGKTTTDPTVAMDMVRSLDQQAATTQLLASVDYLRSQSWVLTDKIGSIGWCFGGAMSLKLALNDPKLTAAVIYYGQPVTDPKELAKIKAAILGIYGEADQMIPMEKVQEFQKALAEARVKYEIHTYPDAPHAFANPSGGKGYRPEAAADAWKKTIAFLARTLKRNGR